MSKIDEDSPVSRWLKNAKAKEEAEKAKEKEASSGEEQKEDELSRLKRRVEQLETEQQRRTQRRRTQSSDTPKTPKSLAVGYILLLIFGHLGFHRFYFEFLGSGAIQLIMGITGWVVLWFFSILAGIIILAVLGAWLLLDLFLIPAMIQEHEINMKPSDVDT